MIKTLLAGLVTGMMVFGGMVGASATPVQWASGQSANNHWYDVITTGSTISWEEARNATVGSDWHLVTITDADEDSFIFDFLDNQKLTSSTNYWLGGYQINGSANEPNPDQGWSWVTGESWNYTNWYANEPNNGRGGTQHYLHYWPMNQWDDMDNRSSMVGYVVERNADPVPEPATMLLFGTGLIGLASARIRRKKKQQESE